MSEEREADDLMAAVTAHRFSFEADDELMKRAIDLIVRLRAKLQTQGEAIALSRQIIERLQTELKEARKQQ